MFETLFTYSHVLRRPRRASPSTSARPGRTHSPSLNVVGNTRCHRSGHRDTCAAPLLCLTARSFPQDRWQRRPHSPTTALVTQSFPRPTAPARPFVMVRSSPGAGGHIAGIHPPSITQRERT